MKNADKQYTFGSDAYTMTVDGKKDNGTEIKLGALVEDRVYQKVIIFKRLKIIRKTILTTSKSVALTKDVSDCNSKILVSCKATEKSDGSGKASHC